MRLWHYLIHGRDIRRVTVTPPALNDTREERWIWLCGRCAESWDGPKRRI